MIAEHEAGQELDLKIVRVAIEAYENKWEEWILLKKQSPNCPALYEDHRSVHCGLPFQTSLDRLNEIILE